MCVSGCFPQILEEGVPQRDALVLPVRKLLPRRVLVAGVELDAGHKYTPGQKFAHWEHKGVALRDTLLQDLGEAS